MGSKGFHESKIQNVRVRFEWCARLVLPWDGRVRVAAASGITAAAYGAAMAVWPRWAVRRVRAYGIKAVLRTRFRAAPDAVACLGLPWRADFAASVALQPRDFLFVARDVGEVSPHWFEE